MCICTSIIFCWLCTIISLSFPLTESIGVQITPPSFHAAWCRKIRSRITVLACEESDGGCSQKQWEGGEPCTHRWWVQVKINQKLHWHFPAFCLQLTWTQVHSLTASPFSTQSVQRDGGSVSYASMEKDAKGNVVDKRHCFRMMVWLCAYYEFYDKKVH